MSYILNALRKAEQEHQAGNHSNWLEKDLPENMDQKKSLGFWLFGALILINLATLSYFIWFNSPKSQRRPYFVQEKTKILVKSDSDDNKLPRNEAGSSKFIEEITAKPDIQQASKKITREAVAETVTVRKVEKAKRIQIAQEQKRQISTNKLADKSESVQKKKSISLIDSKLEPLSEDKANVESFVFVDKKNTGENSLEQVYIPALKELPLDFRRRVPKININVYVYSEDDAERFVVVDMVKYTSGSIIVDNMELKEIRSDSLVVEYNGETFRIMRP